MCSSLLADQPSIVIFPVLVIQAMAPKGALMARTKKAGTVLSSQQESDKLTEEKKMKASLKQITKDKKKANRKARALKLKASKINLSDLLQMMMMKAFVLSEEEAEKNGARSSSSSGEPWRPKNAKEAFEKIVEVTNSKEAAEVAKFAKELQSEVSE